ncbi:MAG: DUF4230 domain-containing protein [Anaerolineae bacterium]|nr:DUF4230 domain-containing protein [Anaerolineae bacterium]
MSQDEPTPKDEEKSTSSPSKRDRGGRFNRTLTTLILVGILLVILVIGFLLVDTVLSVTRPASDLADAVSTEVSQVFNPTPTIIANPQTIVKQIESLARLETASYTIEKVITAESGEGPFGFLFSDKLLLVAQGQVIAGVDMELIRPEDVRVSGTSVFITLPAAEIFVATLDNDNTYVYDRETAIFGQQVELETLARQEAESAILEAALEDGILDMAQDNAEGYVGQLMTALGFEEVVFVRGTPSPDQNLGD